MGVHRLAHYSRGLRQRILKKATEDGWGDKYRIRVGAKDDASMPGSYSEGLARSVFCLVLPGDGWSSRAEDAAAHGCIPVVIMDRVHAVFESILDWDLFSVRVAESEVESLPQILAAISDARVRRMQVRVVHLTGVRAHPESRMTTLMTTLTTACTRTALPRVSEPAWPAPVACPLAFPPQPETLAGAPVTRGAPLRVQHRPTAQLDVQVGQSTS
jgi:hypothetical protein